MHEEKSETLTRSQDPLVSIVLPCLNEERTLGHVIEEVKQVFSACPYGFEIIVADNDSTDQSAAIANSLGVRVVSVSRRGYGAALQGGIEEAKGRIILFGDADRTYDFSEGPSLVQSLMERGASMAVGSRLRGTIETGAMPLLHQYLGTPALTRLINLLFRSTLTDCNSGFRSFYKETYRSWQVHSEGMEFASELIINCLKAGGSITEMPVRLRKDHENRTPHLSTWRDGMRHLLFILSRAPHGFTYSGLALTGVSLLIALPCMLIGPIRIGHIEVFDLHSLIVAILIEFFAVQSLSYGLILDAESIRRLAINAFFLDISEVSLLKTLLGWLLFVGLFALVITAIWIEHGFNNLHYVRASLSILYLTVLVGGFGYGLFVAQVHKRI